MDVRPLVFRLDDYDKTLVLARATELVAHRSRATFSLEAEVRTRLMRRIGDDSCMRSLRQWVTARNGAEYGLHFTTNHELIELVLAAVHLGQVVATLTPAVHSTLRQQPPTAIDERTRRLVERATAPALAAAKIAASGPAAAGQSPAAPSVAKMTSQEKIEELLKLTIPKLPDAIRPQFVAMVATIGVIKIAEIFVAWAVSQFVGVGEVVDLLLGVALAIGVVFTGWSFYSGTKQLLEAVNGALDAQTEAKLDSSATEMAEAVTTLGVAVLTLAMMGGAKGAAAEADAGSAGSAGDSAAAKEAAAQRAAAEKEAAEKAAAEKQEEAAASSKRVKTAREFYKRAGFSDRSIGNHLKGIDFSKPVTVTTLQPGEQYVQYSLEGEVGNYFAPVGTPVDSLGINPAGRTATIFTPTEPASALQSTAAEITDTWTVPGSPCKASGGGTQFFVPNKTAMSQ